MKVRQLFLPAVVVLGSIVPALGQVDTAGAQRKLLSKRAAEADAYRKLAEAVKGLQITSDTYVKDFVAESDDIRAEMDEFIRGVRLGEPKWAEDLSCEVPGEVTVAKVVEEIKELHTRHYKGHHIKGKDIEEITQHVHKDVIRVVGMGSPRADLPPDLPEGVAEQLGGPPVPPEPKIPDLWRRIGSQGRQTAERAAELDAKRKLLERIKGLRINSETTVRDFVAESDQITAQASGKIIGATIVHTYLHDDEPIAEVTVEIPLEVVQSVIKEIHMHSIQGDRVKGTDISDVTRTIKSKTFRATGTGIPKQQFLRAYNSKIAKPEDRLPAWAMAPIIMTGQCAQKEDKAGTPQGKLMAARCAEVKAKEKLAEYIYGLNLSSSTKVKDFVAEHDEIRTQVDAVVVGAFVKGTVFQDDGTAEVTVVIEGLQVWGAVNGPKHHAAPGGELK